MLKPTFTGKNIKKYEKNNQYRTYIYFNEYWYILESSLSIDAIHVRIYKRKWAFYSNFAYLLTIVVKYMIEYWIDIFLCFFLFSIQK